MINREKIEELLDEVIEDEPRLSPLTINGYDDIVDIVEKLIETNSEVSKYHEEEVRSLVSGVAFDISKGGNKDDVFASNYGMRGYSYYNNFLGTGELGKIFEALKENDLPVDVLSIVTKGSQPDTFVHPKLDLKITQVVEKVKGSSPIIVYFAIIYNGKTIYSFGDDDMSDRGFTRLDGESDYDYYGRMFAKKQNKRNKSHYAGSIVMSSGETYKKWVTQSGKVFYTNWKGYRVKV